MQWLHLGQFCRPGFKTAANNDVQVNNNNDTLNESDDEDLYHFEMNKESSYGRVYSDVVEDDNGGCDNAEADKF